MWACTGCLVLQFHNKKPLLGKQEKLQTGKYLRPQIRQANLIKLVNHESGLGEGFLFPVLFQHRKLIRAS